MSRKIGWSFWTRIRLLFVKPCIATDGDCFLVSKVLDGKIYIIRTNTWRTNEKY